MGRIEEAGLVIAFHIGTDAGGKPRSTGTPAGRCSNYLDTTFGGQGRGVIDDRGGALERHPTCGC